MELPEIKHRLKVLHWTQEMDDFVAYWKDRRKSYQWIADRMGISRCAVIGRAYRKGKGNESDIRNLE